VGSDDVMIRIFEPQPPAGSLPARFPTPFGAGRPHALARRAAGELQAELALGRPLPSPAFEEPHRGKMFGVLVVEDGAGRIGYLRGFSGMLGGRWELDGFVGPAFDLDAFTAFWPAGEAELIEYDRRLADLVEAAEAILQRRDALDLAHAGGLGELAARHASRRSQRHAVRASHAETQAANGGAAPASEASLVQESRADAAELRRLRRAQRDARAALVAPLVGLEERRRTLKAAQAARSTELLERVHAGYTLRNFQGCDRPLRTLFAPTSPPGGAGDCAAPKLLVHAAQRGLRPVALAEFWWGAPPATGGRHHGTYYPSCRGKCGPVLAHLLEGVACEPLPVFGDGQIAAEQPATLYEDRFVTVVEKPAGLLSVPGRNPALTDAVSTRLRARYPEATGPLLVHRLDLDTSGVMLVAKDSRTYVALQRQFLERTVEKRYVACLSAPPRTAAPTEGRGAWATIALPLRTDVDDRPRQIVDPVAGKAALTEWRPDPRSADPRRVLLVPRTGRTHQLRVHAAHPAGLDAPILGDRLYGRASTETRSPSPMAVDRLFLHAEWLAFTHPETGRRIEVESPAPF
jgi:tRNA pseudouridine32 synthase/23S rRNA pseudouridine746 synthase